MKNTIAAAIMMMVMALGTTVANAGIIIAKEGTSGQCQSTTESKNMLHELGGMILEGIIIAKTGIIIAKEGIIIAKDGAATCTSTKTEGIIIA